MSKKNNKMSKKNNRKNYKIESLEPRLMMDATADGWGQELDVIDPSSISCFSTSTPEFKNWENTNIRTLFVTDRSTNETRVAKVGDLLGTDTDSLNMASFANTDDVKSDLKKIMSFAIDSLKNDYANTCIQKNDVYKKLRDNTANSTERITLKAKLNAEVNNYFKTKLISASELIPLMNSCPDKKDYVFAQGNSADEIVVGVFESISKRVDNLSANVAGFSGVATNLQSVGKEGESKSPNVNIARAYNLRLDGLDSAVVDNASVAVASHFRQFVQTDVADPTNEDQVKKVNANGSVLELTSIADVDEGDPDFSVGLGYSATGMNEIFRGDLDFDVKDSTKISGLTNTSKIKYVYNDSTKKWEWKNASDVGNIEQASMGLILKKLSQLSFWLNQNSTVTPENPIPLLYDSFGGVLSQNASENAKLSSMLDCILNPWINVDIPDSANVDGEEKIVLLITSEENLNIKATVTNS